MKILKNFNQYIKESIDLKEKYNFEIQYLLKILDKCKVELSKTFYLKEPVIVGTCDLGDVYCHSFDTNEYQLGFSVIYNKHDDDLYGCEWEHSAFWIDLDSDIYKIDYMPNKKHNIVIFDNFLNIIVNEIKKYSDLNSWIRHTNEVTTKRYFYHRHAINRDETKQKLTWDERIDNVKNSIESDKLINRRCKPYEQKTLDEMLELGEEEYNKVEKKRNDIAMKILDDMSEIEK